MYGHGPPGKIGEMSHAVSAGFVVLVPVKPTGRAKSRLAALGDTTRRALVEAFVADTVAVASRSSGVVAVMVVTDDHLLAATLRGAGVHVLPDGVAEDLNGSLVQAAAEAHRRWPEAGVAALCADLPALDPADLSSALEASLGHRSAFVPDAAGVGTTMYAARLLEDFAPRFGVGSREEHLDGGAHELAGLAVPTLRRDVDTPEDLREAVALGVGDRTAEVVAGTTL